MTLRELMRVSGIGPKFAGTLRDTHGIHDLASLRQATHLMMAKPLSKKSLGGGACLRAVPHRQIGRGSAPAVAMTNEPPR